MNPELTHELTHILHSDGKWYWKCPSCNELLNPHLAGKGKGHHVLQSKAIAIKHLIAHDVGYIPRRMPIQEIVNSNQYFCNKCGDYVQSKSIFLKSSVARTNPPIWQPKHKFICLNCADFEDWSKGLKTKDEVHKGLRK